MGPAGVGGGRGVALGDDTLNGSARGSRRRADGGAVRGRRLGERVARRLVLGAAAMAALSASAQASPTDVEPETAILETTLAEGGAAGAAPWPDGAFPYVVVRQDLRRYLRVFARWGGVFLDVQRDVQGVVEGPIPLMRGEAVLDRLAADHGLYWWFDGAVLHVGPADDLVTLSEPLASERVEGARAALGRLGLLDPRFPVRLDAAAGFISATGPEPYVRRVLAVARGADEHAAGGPFRRVTIYRQGAGSRVRVLRRFDPETSQTETAQ